MLARRRARRRGTAATMAAAATAAAIGSLMLAVAPASAQPAAAGDVGCNPQLPVVAHHAGGQPVTLPAGSPLPVACATDTGYESSESTLGATNTGAIVYSPAHTENSVAVSHDQGSTWQLSYPPDEQYTSLWNTDDPYLTVDRRTGRVFWSHATGDLRTEPILVANSPLPNGIPTALAYAHGFQVYATPDDGRTWTTADYSHDPIGDWEKVFAGPPPPPSGGAQPSGYPDIVYMCGNSPFEVSGPGRLCYKSLDGGKTFTIAGYVYPSASTPDACSPFGANNGVVDSRGTIYHPVTCQQGSWLAISADEGSSYTWLPVPAPASTSPVSTGPMQLAIDQADNLYVLWLANDHLTMAISQDHGQHWSHPLIVAGPGLRNITLPAIAAGPRGGVGVTYYASTDPSAQTLTAYITQTTDALSPDPLFYTAALNDPAHPIFRAYGFNGTPRADYVGGAYDAHGTFWAGVVRQLGPVDSNGKVPTTGYVGKLDLAGVSGATSPSTAGPGGALLAPGASPCAPGARLRFRINPVPGGRVVRAVVTVNGRRAVVRRGRNLRTVSIRRPRAPRVLVHIVTTNNHGGKVITVRSFIGCTRTPVKGRTHRRPRTRRRAARSG